MRVAGSPTNRTNSPHEVDVPPQIIETPSPVECHRTWRLMVKTRSDASVRQSSVEAKTAWRPVGFDIERGAWCLEDELSEMRSRAWSIPVGTTRIPAACNAFVTCIGCAWCWQSMSVTGPYANA